MRIAKGLQIVKELRIVKELQGRNKEARSMIKHPWQFTKKQLKKRPNKDMVVTMGALAALFVGGSTYCISNDIKPVKAISYLTTITNRAVNPLTPYDLVKAVDDTTLRQLWHQAKRSRGMMVGGLAYELDGKLRFIAVDTKIGAEIEQENELVSEALGKICDDLNFKDGTPSCDLIPMYDALQGDELEPVVKNRITNWESIKRSTPYNVRIGKDLLGNPITKENGEQVLSLDEKVNILRTGDNTYKDSISNKLHQLAQPFFDPVPHNPSTLDLIRAYSHINEGKLIGTWEIQDSLFNTVEAYKEGKIHPHYVIYKVKNTLFVNEYSDNKVRGFSQEESSPQLYPNIPAP
ncbi:hypothetical protein GOV11_05225 [Candidatus Woesearchaeota archaeon]|nr:hypothetical protein [Candidatus Woesearchaeota archaeon]